jgi:hypothetical protein
MLVVVPVVVPVPVVVVVVVVVGMMSAMSVPDIVLGRCLEPVQTVLTAKAVDLTLVLDAELGVGRDGHAAHRIGQRSVDMSMVRMHLAPHASHLTTDR